MITNLKLEDMLHTSGLLMIDEAENHLHPKWQKSFLNSILSIFPNIQIIVTTHSPFIVSSIENAKVFVCKSMQDHSIIVDETDIYSNKPIDYKTNNYKYWQQKQNPPCNQTKFFWRFSPDFSPVPSNQRYNQDNKTYRADCPGNHHCNYSSYYHVCKNHCHKRHNFFSYCSFVYHSQ